MSARPLSGLRIDRLCERRVTSPATRQASVEPRPASRSREWEIMEFSCREGHPRYWAISSTKKGKMRTPAYPGVLLMFPLWTSWTTSLAGPQVHVSQKDSHDGAAEGAVVTFILLRRAGAALLDRIEMS